jgi:hypothetical protein
MIALRQTGCERQIGSTSGDGLEHRSAAMEVRQFRQFVRPDIALSVIIHLSLVAIVVVYTEFRPFRPVAADQVPVDIVIAGPDKKQPDPEPTPSPSPDFSMLTRPDSLKVSSSSASPQPQQPAPSKPAPPQSQPPAQQASQQPLPPQAAKPPQAATPSYATPEPDLTVKYHVMLGLPEDLSPAAASSGDRQGEGGDTGPATSDLATSLVNVLRRHLRTCSKLPSALSPSDNVAVKLRVQMTPDGRLATEPVLIEGSASMKGVELMRGAVAALAACQPYSELPADRYGEWKVLDLSFTPHDFSS